MKPAPNPESGLTAEEASKRSLFNRITVGALILVGVLGSLLMLRSVFLSNQPIRAKPAVSTTAAQVADNLKSRVSDVTDGEGRHLLQLGVFSDFNKAEDLRAKLETSGLPSTLSTGTHVFVGPFSTREEADATRARLKQLGLDG